jgi:streptomycin 6-kinase
MEVATRQVPKNWHITGYGPPLGPREAPSRQVAREAGAAVLTHVGDLEEANEIAGLLRWYRGIGCIRLLHKHRDMLLLEWLNGPTLADLLPQGREAEALDALCEVAGKLHRTRRSRPKASLTPLDQHLLPLLAQLHSSDPLLRHAARLARGLIASTAVDQPLHGALGLNSIRRHDERGWLASLPLGLLGDPHYEFAPALTHGCHPRDILSATRCVRARAGEIATRCDLERDRLLTFAFCHAAQSMLTAEAHGQSPLMWRDRTLTLLDSLVED